jgi:hypothetical protein
VVFAHAAVEGDLGGLRPSRPGVGCELGLSAGAVVGARNTCVLGVYAPPSGLFPIIATVWCHSRVGLKKTSSVPASVINVWPAGT